MRGASIGVALGLSLLARIAAGQVSDTTTLATGATVGGVVRDSIARAPIAGAVVQLVSAESQRHFGKTTVSDSLGRYVLKGVPDGRYTLGFFHPLLDSLGIEPLLREVFVAGPRPVRVDLATPSPTQFRDAICGAHPLNDSSGVVVGTVRDARDFTPASGVSVTGEWMDISFTRDGLVRRAPRLVATTGENGWFALCNVPGAGTITVIASRGADSTDFVEVQVAPADVVRRELYLAPVALRDTDARTDTTVSAARVRLRTGNGLLSGTVVTTSGGKPVGGAQVGIVNGPQTNTNERGEWTISDAPSGTRMLEVHAIGYYPERRAVDVVAGAPIVRVALSTLKAMLETIKVTANRPLFDRNRNGFQQRRRTGAGRYLTSDDIAIKSANLASEIFRNLPGFHVQRDADGFNNRILQNNPLGACAPTIFIDGRYLPFTADDLDDWVSPGKIASIEVYTEANAPPQFREYTRMDACGSIVIWTK